MPKHQFHPTTPVEFDSNSLTSFAFNVVQQMNSKHLEYLVSFKCASTTREHGEDFDSWPCLILDMESVQTKLYIRIYIYVYVLYLYTNPLAPLLCTYSWYLECGHPSELGISPSAEVSTSCEKVKLGHELAGLSFLRSSPHIPGEKSGTSVWVFQVTFAATQWNIGSHEAVYFWKENQVQARKLR